MLFSLIICPQDVVRYITLAETMIARAKSLKSKFTKDLLDQKNAEKELEQFVVDLLHHQEVSVRGGPYGPAGSIIHKLFVAAQKVGTIKVHIPER